MIRYGAGECLIKYRGEIAGLEINFTGKIEIRSNVPDSWLLQANKNKIIVIAFQKDIPLNELLFTYEGKLKLISVRAVNWELELTRLPIKLQGVYQPEKINSFPETIDLKPEKLSGTFDYNPKNKKINKTKVIRRAK